MRWRTWDYDIPRLGTERVISRFLWFPLKLEGEYRWLEHAKIVQHFKTSMRFENTRWG